ncbi:MAG: 5-formyltetrahydrofolate cyclo-ligase [Rubrivivax sp. SCN 70-15]|nr:MAG: 5-formyltetrahydrofolate cyclo-ligase [Rubrivivax sp. SCN 70-15]
MLEVVDRDEQRRAAVMRWRRTERQRLMDARLALPSVERRARSTLIASHLDETLGDVSGLTVAVYWPFRGEPNLRPWMERIHARGARCALPVVVERRAPLVFRAWRPGARMTAGFWDIPVPADGCEVTPDVVLAPVVGFDAAGYRLGYGGGFYDRTLAAMARRPRVIGVGLGLAAIATIHPLAHDIPMQVIVTEGGP